MPSRHRPRRSSRDRDPFAKLMLDATASRLRRADRVGSSRSIVPGPPRASSRIGWIGGRVQAVDSAARRSMRGDGDPRLAGRRGSATSRPPSASTKPANRDQRRPYCFPFSSRLMTVWSMPDRPRAARWVQSAPTAASLERRADQVVATLLDLQVADRPNELSVAPTPCVDASERALIRRLSRPGMPSRHQPTVHRVRRSNQASTEAVR